jgi:hypothetical protein
MGVHSGSVRVYGVTRLRWLAPLLRTAARPWLWSATLIALMIGSTLVGVNLVAVVAVVFVPVAGWAGVGAARLTAPHVNIVDRYHWEQVDRACDSIVRHLPDVSVLSRKEVRSATDAARWELACLIRDRSRLMGLQRDTDRSARGLADDDPLRDELAQRRATLDEQLEAIGAEVEQRTRRLQGLATQSSAFAAEEVKARRGREATDRAQRTLTRADAGIADATAWGTRVDPAADFAERAELVLAAYEELSGHPIQSADTEQGG